MNPSQGKAFRQQAGEMRRRSRRQQTMVVVDEIDEALVDALVIGHVGQRRMNPHRLADDSGSGRPALTSP